MMRKNKLGLLSLSLFAVSALLTSCGPNTHVSDWTKVEFTELPETVIGTNLEITAGKLDQYAEDNPLRIALVTDSGTLNDHSFNEASWKGVNEFAEKNGGGTIGSDNMVSTGKIQTHYYQPAENAYDTNGRLAAMRTAVTEFGADVIVLPGYLFQGAIKMAIENTNTFGDVHLLALDCVQEDDRYQPYEYTDNVTSVIYREEQAGWLAGYAAVQDGYRNLGFVGGMPVPAVIRYGSGYVQGAAYAAQELGLETPVNVQYYYSGEFAATTEATQFATSWYQNKTAEIIFACGGAVYQSVVQASIANNNAPWIGVDVNQHADTSLGAETLGALKTSAMKNLQQSVEVLLTSWVNNDGAWEENLAAKVNTVGVQSGMCKLPTPKEDGDPDCWGFENFTIEEYNAIYAKLKSGEIKVNSNSINDNDEGTGLAQNNFGVNPEYAVVNYIG